MKIDGPTLLRMVFHKYDVHSWGMFGTLIGYVFFFRFVQYFLFAYQTGAITFRSPSVQPQEKTSYQAVPTTENHKQSGSSLEVAGTNSKL